MNRALTLAALLGATTAGCSFTASTRVQNPLAGHALTPNSLEWVDTVGEATYDLPPRTLVQRASLTSLTSAEVCFRLVLTALDQERGLASPLGWQIHLGGDPEFDATTYELREQREETETIVRGSIERQAVTQQQICGEGGRCWVQDAVTTYRDPVEFGLVTGGGVVCFANEGRVKPESAQVTLELARPSGPRPMGLFDLLGGAGDDRVAFRWNLQ